MKRYIFLALLCVLSAQSFCIGHHGFVSIAGGLCFGNESDNVFISGSAGYALDIFYKDVFSDSSDENKTKYFISPFVECQFLGETSDKQGEIGDILLGTGIDFYYARPKISYSLLHQEWIISSFGGVKTGTSFNEKGTLGWNIGIGLDVGYHLKREFWDVSVPFSVMLILDTSRRKRYEAYNAEQAIEAQKRYEERMQEERQTRETALAAYTNARDSKSVSRMANYIEEWSRTRYFVEQSYTDIARFLTNNENAVLKEFSKVVNPYSFDEQTVYYAKNNLSVQQWVGNGSFLARLLSSYDMIFIRKAYNVKAIQKYIKSPYLKYVGTYEYVAVSGAQVIVPMFDLLYMPYSY